MMLPGEERYREELERAEGHESRSAMIRCADLRAALAEIERLRADLDAIASECMDNAAAVFGDCPHYTANYSMSPSELVTDVANFYEDLIAGRIERPSANSDTEGGAG